MLFRRTSTPNINSRGFPDYLNKPQVSKKISKIVKLYRYVFHIFYTLTHSSYISGPIIFYVLKTVVHPHRLHRTLALQKVSWEVKKCWEAGEIRR
jgi:hypothetical protein